MPSSSTRPGEASKRRVQKVIALAHRLQASLSRRQPFSQQLRVSLHEAIQNDLPFFFTLSQDDAATCDRLGCELWNTSIVNLPQTAKETSASLDMDLITLSKALAFLLIDAGLQVPSSRIGQVDSDIRLLKIAGKAAHFALVQKQHDLARKVLERCSELSSQVSSSNEEPSTSNLECLTFYQSYLLLRIRHAHAVERMDLAEHFLAKLDLHLLQSSTQLTEKATLLFHDISCSLKSADEEMRVQWLNRTLSTLDMCKDASVSTRMAELRLTATFNLIQILTSRADATAVDTAWNLAFDLDTIHRLGERLPTRLAQLKAVSATSPLRRDLIVQIMSQIVNSPLSFDNLKDIHGAIHQVHKLDPASALYSLERLILSKLALNTTDVTAREDWLAKSVMLLVHYVTSEATPDTIQTVASLTLTFDNIYKETSHSLQAKPTHAIQTLLWKFIDRMQDSDMVAWIQLMQHPLLAASGPKNKACIGKKAITIHLAQNDLVAARKAYFGLPEIAQNEPNTRCLAYKIAVRSEDHLWAAEHLKAISSANPPEQVLLQECAQEAQHSASRPAAILALQTLVEASNRQPSAILLRCLVRLRIGELDKADEITEEHLEVLANLLELSMHVNAEDQQQQLKESAWCMKTAYNMAIRYFQTEHRKQIMRLLKVCLHHSETLKRAAYAFQKGGDTVKIAQCQFMTASCLIAEARAHTTDQAYSLQCYLEARQHIAGYLREKREAPTASGLRDKELERTFELRRFDLEAIFRLKQWDHLDGALSACLAFDGIGHWDKLADLVLTIHEELCSSESRHSRHEPQILDLLQKMINETWKRDRNIIQVARWVRTTMSISLARTVDEGNDDKVALKLLDQAASLASRAIGTTHQRYPDEELQWLASVAFNRGIDFCVSGQKTMTWKWFDAALEVARYTMDDGALHACLTSRRAQAEQELARQGH